MKRTHTFCLILLMTVLCLGMAGTQAARAGAGESASDQEFSPPPENQTPGLLAQSCQCPNCANSCTAPEDRQSLRGRRGKHGRNIHPGFRNKAPRSMHQSMRSHPRSRGRGLPANRILRNATRLDLSENQISSLRELGHNGRLLLIDLKADLDKTRVEMKRLMQGDAENTAAIKKQMRTLADKRLVIQELKLENWIDSRKLLTDNQKEIISDCFPRWSGTR